MENERCFICEKHEKGIDTSYGLKDVLITCIQGNEGSKHTILANGGVYESTVYCEPDNVYFERYWVHL